MLTWPTKKRSDTPHFGEANTREVGRSFFRSWSAKQCRSMQNRENRIAPQRPPEYRGEHSPIETNDEGGSCSSRRRSS
jgi:hypothetical protein